MSVDGFKIDKSDTDKLLGVKYDRKLTFDDHISDICKKNRQKNIYFGQNYTIHIWMCHSRTNKQQQNKLELNEKVHEKVFMKQMSSLYLMIYQKQKMAQSQFT